MARLQRIDQLLSHCGYCSRSEARGWVRAGRVQAGGEAVRSPADKADPAGVTVDGEALDHPEGILALLHKPVGCVCSHDASEGPTIYDLLPGRWTRRNPPVNSVGRLDRDASGLLLITDRGEWVHQWTSPRHQVPKLYEVGVDGLLEPGLVGLFAAGTLVLEGEDQPCRPARLELCGPREARLQLTEGRFHQVKRMFAAAGLRVTRLHRVRFGEFELGGLAPGEFRLLPLLPPAPAAGLPAGTGVDRRRESTPAGRKGDDP